MSMTSAGGAIWYSLFNSLGYLSAAIIFYRESKRKQYSFETLLYILFGALLGGLIGSRIGSALFVYREHYSRHIFDLFIPQVGGKTLVGGLIGGYLGVVIAKKILKFSRSTGDLFAPGLALGIAIGRIGCFCNGCCYGIPTNVPWGVVMNGIARHPTQLYESIFCMILFVYLWLIRKKIHREGDLFKLFLIWYAFFRFWVEFLREDKVMFVSRFSIAQVVAGSVFIALLIYFLKYEWIIRQKEAFSGKKDL